MGQMKTEYVVHFKGDYSALAKDLQKINVATTKLEEDEVIIKLNYDGNIQEFNKVFDKISKMHPEIGIQFQYNVNQKLLEQEMDRLDKLTKLKIDIDDKQVAVKMHKMIDGIELSLQKGISKDSIQQQVKEVFGYYNTAIQAGAKNIDFNSITDRLYQAFDVKGKDFRKLFDDLWEQNDKKPIELLQIDKSLFVDLEKTKERITDIQGVLKDLEKSGASKSGLPSELQKAQDEIKIMKADIAEMKDQLKDATWDAFKEMAQEIKSANQQLDYAVQTVEKLKRITSSNGLKELNSIGGIVRQWQEDDITKVAERYSAYNSKTKQTSGAHLAAGAEGVSEELIRSAIKEMGEEADGTIHSHPHDFAAFSDNDIETYFKLFKETQGKLFSHAATAVKDAMTIDMSKVDISKEDEIIQEIRGKYTEIDKGFLNNITAKTESMKNVIVNVLSGVESKSPIINEMTENIKNGIDGMFKGLGESFSFTDYQDAFDTLQSEVVANISKKYASSMGIDAKALSIKLAQSFLPVLSEIENAFLDPISNLAQQEYQKVLQTVFTDPKFIKVGETSAIKIQALTDFIDWGSIEDSAKTAAQKGAKALQEAQDSNSPAKLTKPLGKDFGEGYAEGIREAMPEIVAACKEIVLGAYNAINEASKSGENGETQSLDGFFDSFKESLESSALKIQGVFDELFAKISLPEESKERFYNLGSEIIQAITSEISRFNNAIEISSALEKIIESAFKQITLDLAVYHLVEQIQNEFNNYSSSSPFVLKYFDVNTDNIIADIQSGLDQKSFNINLGGTIQDLSSALNTSADNVRLTFVDALRWMREADRYQRDENPDDGRERVLYFNSKTGEFTNPTIYGNDTSAPWFFEMRNDYESRGTKFDTHVHTHVYDDYAFPSGAGNNATGQNIGDVEIFFNDAMNGLWENISKFIVGAQKELAVFDFSKIASNAEELENFLECWIRANIEEVEEVLGRELSSYELTNPRKLAGEYVNTKLLSKARDTRFNSVNITPDSLKDIGSTLLNTNYKDELVDPVTGEHLNFKELIMDHNDLDMGDYYDLVLTKELDDLFDKAIRNILKRITEDFLDEAKKGHSLNTEDMYDTIDIFSQDLFAEKEYQSFTGEIRYRITKGLQRYFDQMLNEFADEPMEWSEAGSKALRGLSETDSLISKIVKYYTPEEFEKEFGANISQQTNNNQISTTPILSDDFRQQLQTSIDETGRYFIEVVGDLVDDFKIELQKAIDELGAFRVEVSPYVDKGKGIEGLGENVENSQATKSVDAIDVGSETTSLLSLQSELDKVINLVDTKTEAFIEEGNIVDKVVTGELDSLNKLSEFLKELRENISKISDELKGIDINISLGDKSNDFIKFFDSLSKIKDDEIVTKLITVFDALSDFAKDINSLKINDDSIISSINNLLSKTKELENLATVLKASKKDIKNAGKVTSPTIDTKPYDKAIQKAQEVINSPRTTNQFKAELDDLIGKINDYRTKFNNLTKDEKQNLDQLLAKLKQVTKEAKITDNKKSNELSVSKALGQLNDMISKNTKLSFRKSELYQSMVALQQRFKQFDTSKPVKELKPLLTELAKLKAEFKELDNSTRGKGFLDTFKERLVGANAQFLTTYFSLQDWIRYGRQAVETIVGLDTALVDLRKTSTMSSAELQQFYYNSNDVAKSLGVTTEQVINQAAAWSRLNNIGLLYGNI